MSKIIVIESVEALAEQVIKAIGLWEVTETDTRTKDEVVLSCLHPIEVPNEAGELVNTIIMLFAEAQIKQTDEAITQALAEAAALIESYGRRVPRAMLEELFDTGYREGDRHIAYDSIDPIRRGLNRIAAKYGVKVEG